MYSTLLPPKNSEVAASATDNEDALRYAMYGLPSYLEPFITEPTSYTNVTDASTSGETNCEIEGLCAVLLKLYGEDRCVELIPFLNEYSETFSELKMHAIETPAEHVEPIELSDEIKDILIADFIYSQLETPSTNKEIFAEYWLTVFHIACILIDIYTKFK
jgi:hypothetical protein